MHLRKEARMHSMDFSSSLKEQETKSMLDASLGDSRSPSLVLVAEFYQVCGITPCQVLDNGGATYIFHWR